MSLRRLNTRQETRFKPTRHLVFALVVVLSFALLTARLYQIQF
jgi:hypothetical protein